MMNDYMLYIIGVPFLIMTLFYIMSLRNKLFKEINNLGKLGIWICSLIPIWGIVLAIGTIVYFYHDLKNAGKSNRIFKNTFVNKVLFGEDKCEI